MINWNDCVKVVGTKQTLKAIKEGKALKVVLAEDTEMSMKEKIENACHEAGIKLLTCESKAELGQSCGIERSAAVVAVIEEADARPEELD